MNGKPLPRFEHERITDRLVRPLPPPMAELAAETAEATRHAQLGERYGEARTRLAALNEKLQAAEVADREAERRALERGMKVPKGKAEAVRQEIEEARHQLDVLADLLRESSAAYLEASIPFLGEALQRAENASERALDEAADLLRATDEAFTRAAELSAAAGWITGLARTGVVHTWAPQRAPVTPRAAAAVRGALPVYEEERVVRAEDREGEERRQVAEAKMPLPPGTTIWRGGETVVVGEDGEEVEP